MQIVDLFCGSGGLSCGFAQEGFNIFAGIDLNSIALKTYSTNFPNAKTIRADLNKIKPDLLRKELNLAEGELACLIGGPPCQGFSKNVPAANRQLNDPRNILMQVFLDYVKEFKPQVVVIENVAEIVNAYNQAISSQIISQLNELNYYAHVKILNAADYGVPQLRRRAIFLASRKGLINFPAPTHHTKSSQLPLKLFDDDLLPYTTVWEALSDLPSLEAGQGIEPMEYAKEPSSNYQNWIRNNSKIVYDHIARQLTSIQLERVNSLAEGQSMSNLPEHLKPKQGYSGAYGRLFPQEPARTITRWVFHPGSGRFYHPFDNRVITIREAARLQSFPDWFKFEGTYIQKSHQVGEAVPPLLAHNLAKTIKPFLLK
jgi:DNA (cytosine-5)-methyltransferase 1